METRDAAWARGRLRQFQDGTLVRVAADAHPTRAMYVTAQPDEVLQRLAVDIELILDWVLPGWRTTVAPHPSLRWARHREVAGLAMVALEHWAGPPDVFTRAIPALGAGRLHPWAWAGACSMWASRHYRQGVIEALKRVNVEAQKKTGRFDLAETKLFQQLFSLDAPKPGAPRLRLRDDDGSDTYKSVHRGAAALAEGLFAGVRNPAAHTVAETEADEQHAFEQLAAVSVLARWVDAATVASAA